MSLKLALFHTTAEKGDIAFVWDVNTGTCLQTHKGDFVAGNHGIAIEGGYFFVYVKDKASVIVYCHNKQYAEPKKLFARGGITSLTCSVTGSYLALAVRETIYVYQTQSGMLYGRGNANFQPIVITKFDYTGCLLACGDEAGTITIWNILDMKKPMGTYSHRLPVVGLDFIDDGPRYKIISCSKDRTVIIYDLLQQETLLSILCDNEPTAFTLADSNAFVGHHNGSITRIVLTPIPLASANRQKSHGLHDQAVTALTSSPDYSLLMSGSADCTIKIWHIHLNVCLRVIQTKSAITNLICTYISSTIFEPSFSPSLIVNDFTDSDVNELFIAPGTELRGEYTCSTAQTHQTIDDSKIEIGKLKSANAELYKYCVEKFLEDFSLQSADK